MNQSNERYMEVASRLNLIYQGASPGVVSWLPAGLVLLENLKKYIRGIHKNHAYMEVKSPSLVGLSLFEKSGHLAKYHNLMFMANQSVSAAADAELSGYALRPMSCPNHIELYASSRRSYRELPYAVFEFGEVFRNEPSGSLQALFRQRQFCQDDSHVFAMDNQVPAVASQYLKMAEKVFKDLGFDRVEYALSLRPAERFGSEAQWDVAENHLRAAFDSQGLQYIEQQGEGAFYGPKIEIGVRDKLGRLWQMGTLQLDYVLPERFDLNYQASSGAYDRPVLLHHAVLGSLERMIGILLEVHGDKLPDFLHPYPAVVLSVSEKSADYAQHVGALIAQKVPDVVVDSSNDTLGARLRVWRQRGALNIYVVGEKEAKDFQESGEAWAMSSKALPGSSVWLNRPVD